MNGPKGKGFADFQSENDRDLALERIHMKKLNDREIYARKIDTVSPITSICR